jgi:hypothetical protein
VREARPIEVELLPNQMYLTDLKIDHYTQEYGSPCTNRSVEGKTLMVKNRQFEHGIGSHASSSLHFTLPANAEYLDFYVGVDDEVSGGGSVRFIVKSDEGELWSSGLVRGNNAPVPGRAKVAGLDHIVLVIDADGDNAYDHADWLSLILTLKK